MKVRRRRRKQMRRNQPTTKSATGVSRLGYYSTQGQ
jgi:hypothetical protein